MALTTSQLNQLISLWNVRGPQLAANATSVMQLSTQSPIDLSQSLGPILLLSQVYAQVQAIATDFIMADSDYPTLAIDMQEAIATEQVAWLQLRALLGSFAFQYRLPSLSAIESASAAASLYAPRLSVASIETQLEDILNVPVNSGISLQAFWSMSNQSAVTVDLATIIAMDPVLSSSPSFYNFNSTSDLLLVVLRILNRMSPLAPSVSALISAVSTTAATGFTEPPVAGVIYVSIPAGATIEGLAAMYMGDENLWTQLAQFNNLVYPFISDDPIAQLGPIITSDVTLADDAALGATSITLVGERAVMPDQRIVLITGSTVQIVTVLPNALSLSGRSGGGDIDVTPDIDVVPDWDTGGSGGSTSSAIPITPALTSTFPATSTQVGIYNASYDVGKVLGTGATLFVPSTSGATPTLTSNAIVAQEQFGADIQISPNGQLLFDNGDFAVVSGAPNLTQALTNRMLTKQGTLLMHPQYGTILMRLLGKANKQLLAMAAITDATQSALSDPRIAGTNAMASATVLGDVISIALNLTSNGTELFPPLPLQVPLASLTS